MREPSIADIYFRELAKLPLLTQEEERDLVLKARTGDPDARERLITSNLRLVVKIAKAYQGLGVPLLDLVSEGGIGLMRAVDRYEPGGCAKLSTYSAFWIKSSIFQALNRHSKMIRIPAYSKDQASKMRLAEVKLGDLLGREATDEELAQELNVTRRRVAQLRGCGVAPLSLDAPIGNEGRPLEEVVPDPQAEVPGQRFEFNNTMQEMGWIMDRVLTEQQADVLRLRAGFSGKKMTLQEIANKYGCCREYIRILERKAKRKVRAYLERKAA